MNISLSISFSILEIAVALWGVVLLLVDLWTPPARKPLRVGYLAIAGLGAIFAGSFFINLPETPQLVFNGMLAQDHLALFSKQLFLLAAIVVLLLSIEFAPRIASGISEFYALTIFALAGMMFAASANHFVMAFVSLELIAIVFYILAGFLRNQMASLEAGVKYLILGALSSAFLVYGVALIYGASGSMAFSEIAENAEANRGSLLFQLGLLFVLVGLGFKIAAFPFQFWVPDVYQGAPTPVAAFLSIGSKAAGFVLLLRVLFFTAPHLASEWKNLFIFLAASTILYGNLCALPQRNLKRLLGYSSIANSGYLLLGIAAGGRDGASAVLFYLGGYLFAVAVAFAVIMLASRQAGTEDVSGLTGLHKRSPFLALAMTLSMVSLAGIPPLAGFFGKFLLILAIVEQAPGHAPYYLLAGVAVIGVVLSIYYYFGVVRAIYWDKPTTEIIPLRPSLPMHLTVLAGVAGILCIGILPDFLLKAAQQAVDASLPF